MTYDLVVIGGGTGGLTAARLVGKAGKKVALVEAGRPGGDCLWSGCIPTKALIHSAKLMHDLRLAGRFGITAAGVTLDLDAVHRHVEEAQLAAGRAETPDVIASWGVELIEGTARFLDAETVEAGGRRLRARSFVIATGSRPAVPPIPGLPEAGFDTNEDVLRWERLPRTVAVVGGGPIGIEFAQVLCRFGVTVTLIERLPRLLAKEEPEASTLITELLCAEGVEVVTGAEVRQVARAADEARLEMKVAGARRTIAAERVMVATGRAPVTGGLDLAAAGVRSSTRGIEVDAHLRTSQPHIFAVGDVNGGPQFTHVAEDQARTAARAITGSRRRPPRWNGRVVPRVTFADPEVAAVGLTEEQARRDRRDVRTWTVPLSEVDRANTMGATDGFLKLVTARGWQHRVPGLARRVGDEIVGACFVGPNAGDLLMPVVMAMRARLPVGLVAWNMQAYPTLALGVRQVAGLPFGP